MTGNHKLICASGAALFFFGSLYFSMRNTVAAERLFPGWSAFPAALLVAILLILATQVLFFFLKEKNTLTFALCFLPSTCVWMSLSTDSGWNWAALVLAAATIAISRLNWPDEARDSTLAWTGSGLMVVILAFCGALANGTLAAL